MASITVTSPLLPDLNEFNQVLQEIWDSKWITNNGSFHKKLEAALCEYLKVPYISLFTNGTLPLLTALQALRITGEVITTPYSFVATTHLTWYALLLPLVFMMAGLALGFGTIFSSLTTKYRDLQVLLSFLVSLWMYTTPIVYPLSQTSSKLFMGVPVHTFMCMNPVTPIIETFKYGFLGCGEFVGWRWLIYSFVFMCILLGVGIVVFNKVQKSFMDTV